MRCLILAFIGFPIAAPLAMADPLDQRTARKMLFRPAGFDVQFVTNSGLT